MGNEIVCTTVAIDGLEGNLTYHLLVDMIELEGEFLPVYGVSVALKLADRLESCKIHNITGSREEMLSFITQIAEGTVLPITLRDVIEDFIA